MLINLFDLSTIQHLIVLLYTLALLAMSNYHLSKDEPHRYAAACSLESLSLAMLEVASVHTGLAWLFPLTGSCSVAVGDLRSRLRAQKRIQIPISRML